MGTIILFQVEQLIERVQSNSFQEEISAEQVYLAYLEGEEALKIHANFLEYLDEAHLYCLLDCESKGAKKFSLNTINDYIKKNGIDNVDVCN